MCGDRRPQDIDCLWRDLAAPRLDSAARRRATKKNMVKKKEKKGGKKRATGETKKSSRRDKEARDRLKRFLKKRAPDLSISTALDIQFPALVSLLRLREFGALALSSKENLARTASRPFLAALTNVPILQSPAVIRRVENAEWPGHEVLKIIFMRWNEPDVSPNTTSNASWRCY